MARRYLGYGITNSNGVATLDHDENGNALSHSYTGVGAGKIDIIAESGSLQSETFELLDALFDDECADNSTISEYITELCTISFDTDHYNLTRQAPTTSGAYARRTLPISNYKGKTIKFECEINSPATAHLRIYQTVNGTATSVAGSNGQSGIISVTTDIDSNATAINVRLVVSNLTENQVLSFKKWRVYPV